MMDIPEDEIERIKQSVEKYKIELKKEKKERINKIDKKITCLEDLKKIPDKTMYFLYFDSDRELWFMALKNASQAVINKVFKGMSKRAAIVFDEDMEVFHRHNESDEESAQRKIMDKVRSQLIQWTDLDDDWLN